MKKIVALLAILLVIPAARAHEGHDHGQPKAAPAAQAFFSSEASSAQYEVLVRHGYLEPEESGTLELFISTWATNAPVDARSLTIQRQDDPSVTFTVTPAGTGHYEVSGNFGEKKDYALTVSFEGPYGADLLLLQGIRVGVHPMEEVHDGNEESVLSWWIVGAAFLLGIGVSYALLLAGRRRAAHAVVITVSIGSYALLELQATAHEGHDHGAPAKELADEFRIAKESQFLFGLLTQPLAPADIRGGVRLQATVVPAPNGQSIVASALDGTIASIAVMPGQRVEKGQLMAVVRPALDASSTIAWNTEWNTVNAEYDAAKKELDRLETIRDVISAREYDEARSRYERARSNKELLAGQRSNGSVLPGTTALTASISGIVDHFVLTPGMTITGGQALMTITDSQQLLVEAIVPSSQLGQIDETTRFSIRVQGGPAVLPATLVSVAPVIESSNQYGRIYLRPGAGDPLLRAGQYIEVIAGTGAAERSLVLPADALTEIDGQAAVFVKEAAESYSLRFVETGVRSDTSVAILHGVNEGERAVIRPVYPVKMMYSQQ